jgi:hypothetical protein
LVGLLNRTTPSPPSLYESTELNLTGNCSCSISLRSSSLFVLVLTKFQTESLSEIDGIGMEGGGRVIRPGSQWGSGSGQHQRRAVCTTKIPAGGTAGDNESCREGRAVRLLRLRCLSRRFSPPLWSSLSLSLSLAILGDSILLLLQVIVGTSFPGCAKFLLVILNFLAFHCLSQKIDCLFLWCRYEDCCSLSERG